MRLLLDTHFLIWLAIDPDEIRPRERALIGAAEVIVSAASLWEMRLKWQKRDRHGRRKGQLDPALALAFIAANDMQLAGLSAEDCATMLAPAMPVPDPFDEMLLIHAQRLGVRLLTRDRQLIGHPLAITPA
ncbi:PIN domain-containing protein [Sphingomonas populi]|uniref:PIN domain-containing protein n=1 Tax=Sphingomonas populi TaxID=2484750 RepID=A0A4Q6Y4A8_9SPHN|nr:PIN domain-containing protein [Sphingomonas populi]RZF64239.1 PIN domain-containing protein [Sphingomonas populi]